MCLSNFSRSYILGWKKCLLFFGSQTLQAYYIVNSHFCDSLTTESLDTRHKITSMNRLSVWLPLVLCGSLVTFRTGSSCVGVGVSPVHCSMSSHFPGLHHGGQWQSLSQSWSKSKCLQTLPDVSWRENCLCGCNHCFIPSGLRGGDWIYGWVSGEWCKG